MPPAILTTFLVLTVILVLLPSEVAAFGAGDIPDFSYLEGKAFRHGDIENTLLELVKAAAHSHGGGILGFAQSVISSATGGQKFSKEDVKHVYFGNWLRDYSQAMDIAGLSKLSADTLVLVVGVLGFLEFGFATEEFEVTQDRLGVYLPVEHIDNPRGYAEKEGDARSFHPKLRPPVNSRELEIDSRTGMKNYMATEDGGWDTSTSFIRRTLRECIQKGRSAGGREGPELWEAYRLLGQGLHTLEDFTAHSNWIEITLRKLGHKEVFCHVGDNVNVESPNGRVPPIVTGTFGGADFFHSLLGETTDKISQSSVTDLSAKMSNQNSNAISGLKDILGKLKALGGGDSASQLDQAEEMKRKSEAYHFDPNQSFPPVVVQNLKEVLKFHDDVMRGIIKKMEMIPGLTDLLDGLSNALNAFVYTTIAPYVTPVLTQVTGAVGEGSAAVIASSDQWEVFNNPSASDPTHSVLSKDHFGIILNEPAGKVAKVVVEHSVNLIVQAWSDNSNPDDVLNRILEAFHHPYYSSGRSEIQNKMAEVVDQWLGGMGHSKAQETIGCLTKQAVREGKNKRQGEGSDGQQTSGGYSGGYTTGNKTGGSYGGSTEQSYGGGGYQQSQSKYGSGSGGNEYGSDSYGKSDNKPYGSKQTSYGRSDESSYGNTQSSYGQSGDNYGSSKQTSYSRSDDNYGSGKQTSYGTKQSGYGRSDDDSYGSNKKSSYGQSDDSSYGRTQTGYGQSGDSHGIKKQSYGQSDDSSYGNTQSGYGRSDDAHGGHKGGHGKSDNKSYESTQSGYGRSDNTYGDNRGSRGKVDSGSYEGTQGSYGRSENRSYENTQSGYGRSDDSSGGNRGGYGKSDDKNYGRSENTYGSSSTRQSGADDNSYGGGQKSYGKSDNSNSGSYGRKEEPTSGYGSSGGSYGSKRNDDDRSRETTSNRSGYQPSYQPSYQPAYQSSESTYASGNTYSSGNTYPSGGHDDYGKKSHKKHHDDDSGTYGAERLNLKDDSDDEKRRRGYGGGDHGRSGGYGGGRYGSGDNY